MTDGPDASLLGAARDPRARRAARHPADQAVGAELRRRRQHGAAHRAGGRRRAPATPSSRSAPGLGSLTLALLPVVDRVVAVEVDPVLAGALPETVAQHAPALADRLEVVHADALAVHRPARARRPPRSSRTCPTTSRCRSCCASSSCSRRCAPSSSWSSSRSPSGSPRRPARGPTACRASRPPGTPTSRLAGSGVAQRVLAGAQRRLRARRADPARAAGRRPPPATRSSPASTRRSPSAARRCAPRWRPGPGSPAAGRGCPASRPASTPAPAASSSTSRRSRPSPRPGAAASAGRAQVPAVWLGWAHDRRPPRARPGDRARARRRSTSSCSSVRRARTATTRCPRSSTP